MNLSKRSKKGITLNEVVIGISVIIVIFLIGVDPFIAMKDRAVLSRSVKKIESLLDEAKDLAVSSNYPHGIYFEENRATLFKGESYSSSNIGNKVKAWSNTVVISELTLTRNRPVIIFDKFTRETSQHGKIKLTVLSNPSKFKTITVYPNGNFFSE